MNGMSAHQAHIHTPHTHTTYALCGRYAPALGAGDGFIADGLLRAHDARARDHACLSLIANQRFALIDVAE
jgi:hypothetical protein